MSRKTTLEPDYFEGLYRADPDPWRFTTSPYEAQKYADTLDAIGAAPIPAALEVGCSIGVFTTMLAPRCGRLVATDVSPTALDAARRRCADDRNIEFRLAPAQAEPFAERFDLIVLSEVVYYWNDAALLAQAAVLEAALAPGGRFILVHWLGETDYPKSADAAVHAFRAALTGAYSVERADRTADYRLDLWRRG